MELASLEHGRILTLEVSSQAVAGHEKDLQTRRELMLTRVGDVCALLLPGHFDPLLLAADDHATQRELRRLAEQDLPRLCWLIAVRGEGDGRQRLIIQVHEFSERIHLPCVRIGVDEKLLADIKRQCERRFSMEEARRWLADQLLLAPVASGQKTRVLLIGRPDSQIQEKATFRMLGSRFALDVQREPDGGWHAFRLTRPRTPVTPEQYRPVVLAEGDFEFCDRTIAGQMREGMATELDQLVQAAGSYLGVWREYQAMEERRLVEHARLFGWLSYEGRHRTADGCWIFQLAAECEWTPAQLAESATSEKDLEASTEIPEILSSASNSAAPQVRAAFGRREGSRRPFRGAYAGGDGQTIRLRPDAEDAEMAPPDRGYIHISLRGELKRIQRRREAYQRITTLQTPIPQLALLLENRPVPVRRVQALDPLSAAAKSKFRGASPTPRQVEAIRVALNTPDIALIQGPPGTGKTRTIAAIIERLTEIAKEQGDSFGRVLLSSEQHDAVENAAGMTEIFGLPAMKIGRRRGGETPGNLAVRSWAHRTAAALEADLAGSPRKPLRGLLEEVRVMHAAYVQSPGTEIEAAGTLLRLQALAGSILPASLLDRISSVVRRLKLGTAGLDGEREDALFAVRGLRVHPEAFADDGPRMAWRVLERLGGGPWLTAEDRALLRNAVEWSATSPLDFLAEVRNLRDRLLDDLQAKAPASRTPLVHTEVVGVLDEVRLTVEDLVRAAVDEGAELAVENLIHDLNTDPQGVREVIERYTVVLAATCQHAVSESMVNVLTDGVEFETVIVDEAARANPLDLLIPMSRAARRIILVGDHRQLPHLLEPEVERELEQSVREETRDQLRRSLFERLFLHVKSLEARDGIKRWVTLDTQYRMHSVLGTFVSDAFYKTHNEAFRSPDRADENSLFAHGLGGPYEGKLAAWKVIPHSAGGEERAGFSWLRRAEARWIAGEARRIMEESPGLSLGVISFYTAQVDDIKKEMQIEGLTTLNDEGALVIGDSWRTTSNGDGEPCERLRVGTVDAFQGMEFDVVMLSVTRSNRIDAGDEKVRRRRFGHLLLENRLCVAMSRQKRLLIVVGDSAMAAIEVPGLKGFLELCRSGHGVVF